MRQERVYYTYIMANKGDDVLYIGVTSNLEGRILQHKKREIKGFTSKYYVNKLVYYEEFETAYEAIAREKQLKNWHRQWKINLIKRSNPTFKDIAADWYKEIPNQVRNDGEREGEKPASSS